MRLNRLTRPGVVVVTLALGLGLVSAGAAAAPGALDPSFGSGGKVTTPVQPNSGPHVALQSSGKIIAAATLNDFVVASQVFGVVRYLSNGSLDTSFGVGGVARTDFTIGFNIANSVAVAANDAIVVAGSASSANNATRQIAVARYTSSGALDPTFGSGGKVLTAPRGFSDVANVVVVQPDGKILVGGQSLECLNRGCPRDTALVRYDSAGRLDASFGTGGIVTANLIGPVSALALESDGSILALGSATASGPGLARFTASGVLTSVGLVGSVGAQAAAGATRFQADGKLIVGGTARGGNGYDNDIDVRMQRFLLGGGLDAAFVSPVFDFAGDSLPVTNAPQVVRVDASGRVVVGGFASPAVGVRAFGLARLLSGGALDGSFGSAGVVATQFSGTVDQVTDLVIQPDGKILAAGITEAPGTFDTSIALARYLVN